MTPNLFRYATTELSQDAILCWLLAWADVSHAGHAMHAVGRDLAAALLGAAGHDLPVAGRVEIRRQFEHIDVIALLGDTHVIAIEDKVHAMERLESMAKYWASLRRHFGPRKIAAVYVKTGDQASYAEVEGQNWAALRRGALLEVLSKHEGAHGVLDEFIGHLRHREEVVQRFTTLPLSNWTPRSAVWIGFYEALVPLLERARWDMVNNPRGGFLGLHYGWRTVPGGRVYLQLEEATLCVKVAVHDPDEQSRMRREWSGRVLSAPGSQFTAPDRYGAGRYMTVAVLPGYRASTQDVLDFSATVQTLLNAQAFLASLAENVLASAAVNLDR